MLGQRRRRWPNINPALGQYVVLTQIHDPVSGDASNHSNQEYRQKSGLNPVGKYFFFSRWRLQVLI